LAAVDFREIPIGEARTGQVTPRTGRYGKPTARGLGDEGLATLSRRTYWSAGIAAPAAEHVGVDAAMEKVKLARIVEVGREAWGG
jgi:hypothetical protein